MITITILSGPYAGRTRTPPPNIDPIGLLRDIARRGERWRVDWTAATASEALEWGRADMVARILAAVLQRRAVRLDDPAGPRSWRCGSIDDEHRIVGEIEDAIVGSGRNVYVVSDDDVAVVIGTYGTESAVQ